MTRTFRYIPHDLIPDYLLLGWMIVADLGPIHGCYSVLGEWRCACPEAIPRRDHGH